MLQYCIPARLRKPAARSRLTVLTRAVHLTLTAFSTSTRRWAAPGDEIFIMGDRPTRRRHRPATQTQRRSAMTRRAIAPAGWAGRWLSALLLSVALTVPGWAQPAADTQTRVPVYVFWGDGCPHCAAQKPFLAELAARYPQAEIRSFEVWYQVPNRVLFQRMAARAGFEAGGVPATFIGDRIWVGFQESMKREMEMAVVACIRSPCTDPGAGIVPAAARPRRPPVAPARPPQPPAAAATPEAAQGAEPAAADASAIHLPVIGSISLGARSLPFSTAMIAFVDGFNPCSLWVLSILLALVLHTGSRRKIALVGSTFLVVTAAVYGLFIAGLFKVFTIIDFMGPVQAVVALLALGFALVNIKDYFWYKRGPSFTISDRYKPKIYRDMRGLLTPGRSTGALLGATVVMALGIALIELPCTAGFPVLWSNIVASHNVSAIEFSWLLGLYLTIYLLDELVIFGVAVYTLKMSRMEEKHGRVLKLVGGMVMLALALVLLIDPSRMNTLGGSLAIFAGAFATTGAILLVHRRILPALRPAPALPRSGTGRADPRPPDASGDATPRRKPRRTPRSSAGRGA
jgi:thiol-disulfide isomerase/thioredoxin